MAPKNGEAITDGACLRSTTPPPSSALGRRKAPPTRTRPIVGRVGYCVLRSVISGWLTPRAMVVAEPLRVGIRIRLGGSEMTSSPRHHPDEPDDYGHRRQHPAPESAP